MSVDKRQSFEELKTFIQNFELYQRVIHNFVWDYIYRTGRPDEQQLIGS